MILKRSALTRQGGFFIDSVSAGSDSSRYVVQRPESISLLAKQQNSRTAEQVINHRGSEFTKAKRPSLRMAFRFI
ncbi:hypothetical protein A7K99_18245 [Tatumella citrea]|uniref:Uncharacterized protein n=1 Tax=Tatumella citrea TaxID=53336 RepID=A0A1Y0LBR4_TATCI|nr:hypothetical protein A7K98_18260 [Tatumella citrea]ARU99555.1 hypothetical protein A7K99_18245 [Tatumella citrea]